VSETTIALPDTSEIQSTNDTMTAFVAGFSVADAPSYEEAGKYLIRIRQLRQKLDETFDEPIKKAHEAHKAMLASKKKHEAPLEAAEGVLKRKRIAWYEAEERKRQEAERAAQEVARKAAEERQLQEAIAAEADGDTAAADAILEEPVVAPIVRVEPTVQKSEGIAMTYTYSAQIVDPVIVPREWLIPNEKAINANARSMKESFRIPGCALVKTANERLSTKGVS
jgi:hypothetical protein